MTVFNAAAAEPNSTSNTPTDFSAWQRVGLVALFAMLLAVRLPHAWEYGRFQAEEGTVFLAYAWHYPWSEALFRSFAGYMNLGANAPGVLTVQLIRAGILPLERAPYLTMGIALGFQLLPAVLILTGRAPWLQGRLIRVAALLVIATAPATEEVYYNTLHIQFHLALCVALILALDVPASRWGRLGYGVVLLLAPLCGPVAVVILPLLGLRAIVDRDPQRALQFAILGVGAAIQFLLFYGTNPFRNALDMQTGFAALFVRLFLLPVTGIDITNWAARNIWTSSFLFAIAQIAIIIWFGFLLALAARRDRTIVWLVIAAILVAVVSVRFGIFSIKPRNTLGVMMGERYQYIPLALFGLTFIALAVRSARREKLAWTLLVMVTLLNGAIDYHNTSREWTNGPDWPAEVRLWQSNHNYRMQTWPWEWKVDLSDHARPCSPVTADLAGSKDPVYCESGWIADVLKRQ